MKLEVFKKDCTDDVNDLYCFMNCIFLNSESKFLKEIIVFLYYINYQVQNL